MPLPVGCGLQRPDHFEVTADVPGFTKDQVNVEVHEVGAESLPMTWLLRSTTGCAVAACVPVPLQRASLESLKPNSQPSASRHGCLVWVTCLATAGRHLHQCRAVRVQVGGQ
jgi:hypothetical protein